MKTVLSLALAFLMGVAGSEASGTEGAGKLLKAFAGNPESRVYDKAAAAVADTGSALKVAAKIDLLANEVEGKLEAIATRRNIIEQSLKDITTGFGSVNIQSTTLTAIDTDTLSAYVKSVNQARYTLTQVATGLQKVFDDAYSAIDLIVKYNQLVTKNTDAVIDAKITVELTKIIDTVYDFSDIQKKINALMDASKSMMRVDAVLDHTLKQAGAALGAGIQ